MGATDPPTTPDYDPKYDWPCDTAEAFIEHMHPTHPMWHGPRERDPREWLFRGHSNAEWSLTPAILRPGAVPPEKYWSEPSARRRLELITLRRFLRMVDEQGLPLPEDNQHVRDAEAKYALDGFEEVTTKGWRFDQPWPPIELLSHFALAQHYGLPTQLLDWSRRSLVAAYFAALGAAERPDIGERIAVFALAEPAVVQLCSGDVTAGPQGVVITAPYATNPNLRAQHGVFTVVRNVGEAAPPNIDTLLNNVFKAEVAAGGSTPLIFYYPYLRRITAPVAIAPRLLRLLAYHRIHAATIFPGYGGVARAINEAKLWDKPPGEFPFVLS